LGSCPGRFYRRDHDLAAGTPGTKLEPHFRLVLTGWGIFNIVKGLIDQIVGVHHVRDDFDGPLSWDIGF
jgi:hypothetical protein